MPFSDQQQSSVKTSSCAKESHPTSNGMVHLPYRFPHPASCSDAGKTKPIKIGPYTILKNLGRGGMGEVYLASDPSCGRSVALKRIRPDLKANPIIISRFLREAKVASSLTHPSIIPILSVSISEPSIYYTMPYVEGETLRQILKKTREQEKNGEEQHPIGRSIPSLARIFLQVCEAIAYTHSKGILHRDLKPENIIVGKYGEVMILDWGIADFLDQIKEDDESIIEKQPIDSEDLTRPGKITGTLAYLPPERLHGSNASSVQTDIYALGVILYQLLTLQLPFQRKTIAAFRKTLDTEELIDPLEMAPYREIPHQLAAVSKKCLAKDPGERYKIVEDLIADIKNYIEGKPEWIYLGQLDLNRESDWQLREHILPAKRIAITRTLDVTEWAILSISERSFPKNIRMDAEARIGTDAKGIGFLFSVPEREARESLEEGYCIWIGSQQDPSCRLFRNNVQVMEVKGIYLKSGRNHKIRIEKVEEHLRFYLDDQLRLEASNHLPLAGTHVGLLQRDADFELTNWSFFDGTHNLNVSCLSVPNAFLSYKFYDLALKEFRRIGQSFPGRSEGREALFRAGITLLEKWKTEKNEMLAHEALKEFEKLYRTPGAPLEYLGKSLVYDALGDSEEEAKCLELALRKFPKHSLIPILKEHIVYRMHESSINHREAAYRIILLALRHIPDLLENPDTQNLIDTLQKNWEQLPFIDIKKGSFSHIAIQLAFWLNKPPILVEIAQSALKKDPVDEITLSNALICLLQLDAKDTVQPFLSLSLSSIEEIKQIIAPNMDRSNHSYRIYSIKLREYLQNREFDLFKKTYEAIDMRTFNKFQRMSIDSLEIWRCLLTNDLKRPEKLFGKYSLALITQENSYLHFPYGAWLYLKEGPKAASVYFSSILDTPYPPTTALPTHFLAGRIDEKKGWIERAFWWEKKELHRQLDLFYKAVGEQKSKKI